VQKQLTEYRIEQKRKYETSEGDLNNFLNKIILLEKRLNKKFNANKFFASSAKKYTGEAEDLLGDAQRLKLKELEIQRLVDCINYLKNITENQFELQECYRDYVQPLLFKLSEFKHCLNHYYLGHPAFLNKKRKIDSDVRKNSEEEKTIDTGDSEYFPGEIYQIICNCLEDKDLLACSRVSKLFQGIIDTILKKRLQTLDPNYFNLWKNCFYFFKEPYFSHKSKIKECADKISELIFKNESEINNKNVNRDEYEAKAYIDYVTGYCNIKEIVKNYDLLQIIKMMKLRDTSRNVNKMQLRDDFIGYFIGSMHYEVISYLLKNSVPGILNKYLDEYSTPILMLFTVCRIENVWPTIEVLQLLLDNDAAFWMPNYDGETIFQAINFKKISFECLRAFAYLYAKNAFTGFNPIPDCDPPYTEEEFISKLDNKNCLIFKSEKEKFLTEQVAEFAFQTL
jgi:hypothetical protein